MSQDVWEGSESDRHGEGAADLAHGEGWHRKRAFSYETVLFGGVGLLKEQPVAMLLWTLFLMGTSFAVSCFTSPLTVGIQVAAAAMQLDPMIEGAVNQVVGMTANILFSLPVQQFCYAGLIGFVGHYLRTDEADLSLLFTNVWGGVRATLVAWTLAALAMAVYLPLGGVGFGVYYATDNVEFAALAVALSLLVLIPVGLLLLPLMLAMFSAVLDEVGPMEAIITAWQGGSGARLELFLMGLVMTVVSLGMCMLFCVPFLFVPALHGAGMSVAWLTYSRAEKDVDSWPFIQRNFS
ncbi:MAG: hypothetical protein GWP91_20475 [Rhodobacterales bacterium]|nr:hypothetical protein [Rhodobacterales bacterium]